VKKENKPPGLSSTVLPQASTNELVTILLVISVYAKKTTNLAYSIPSEHPKFGYLVVS
jgi:hypothetical protein